MQWCSCRTAIHSATRDPFSELAVTGRLWSGAIALSDDYVAIDGRLDRIPLRVELALAPAMQPAAN